MNVDFGIDLSIVVLILCGLIAVTIIAIGLNEPKSYHRLHPKLPEQMDKHQTSGNTKGRSK